MAQAFPRRKRKLLVQFVDAEGQKQTGFTQDLSMTGFFVLAPTLPKSGAPLSVVLHLPSGKTLTLTGSVVRQTQPGATIMARSAASGFGFALSGYSEEYTGFIGSLAAPAAR